MSNEHRRRVDNRFDGYTLIEVMVALSVSLLVIAGLQSCLTLALQTIPNPNSPRQREIAATEVLQKLSDDLEYCLWIVDSTPNRIVMVVPDRDRDGQPERVGYRWTSNGVGDVFRKYNDQTEKVLIEQVASFRIDLQSENADIAVPGLVQAGSIMRLDNHDRLNSEVGVIDNISSCGQWIQPTVTSGGSLWRPTQIRLSVWKQGGASEVEIRGGPGLVNRLPAADSMPTDSQILSSGLANFPNKTTLSTLGAPWMQRNQSYCVRVVKTNPAASDAAYKRDAGLNLIQKVSNGWQHSSSSSMAYELDGQWGSAAGDQTLSLAHWKSARVRCLADASGSEIVSTSNLLNNPGHWSRRWQTNNDGDPIDADDDADGSADWRVVSSTMHETTGSHDLDANAIVDVDWRCETAGGEGTVLINAFRSGTTCRPVRLRLTRQADQTHYVILENPSTTNARPLFVLGGLELNTVRTRLVFDKIQQSVTLVANGVSRGTFALSTSSTATSASAIQFGSVSGGVEISQFDVRVWQ